MNTPQATTKPLEQLCLTCGICCNGVLFRDVELQPGDDPAHLKSLGIPLKLRRGARVFNQPCASLEGCACRIYADRPQHCRDFECALLKSVQNGHTEIGAARRIIRKALERADVVRRLLRQLGDTEETLAFSARFRRMSRRLEAGGFDDESAELFSRLTLAVHDLNMLLRDAFYPGSSRDSP
jgi:uncharacterized protein